MFADTIFICCSNDRLFLLRYFNARSLSSITDKNRFFPSDIEISPNKRIPYRVRISSGLCNFAVKTILHAIHAHTKKIPITPPTIKYFRLILGFVTAGCRLSSSFPPSSSLSKRLSCCSDIFTFKLLSCVFNEAILFEIAFFRSANPVSTITF